MNMNACKYVIHVQGYIHHKIVQKHETENKIKISLKLLNKLKREHESLDIVNLFT